MLQNTIALYRNAYTGLSREVWILAIVSLINRSGAMVFPFLTIYLTQSLNFSLREVGLIMSFFGIGSILGSYIGGWLTDQIGAYKVQFWSLICSSIVLLFILKMDTFWSFSIIAILLSTVMDVFRPANKVAVSDYSKAGNMTRSFALLRLAVNLGFAIGPALGGLLAASKGYEWLFYADALTCFLAAIIFKFSLKDNFQEHKHEKEVHKTLRPETTVVMSPYKDKFYMVFLLIIGILAFAFFQLFYTMPIFFKQNSGLDEQAIGLIMGLNGVMIFFLEMPLVYLAEKRLAKFRIMSIGAFLIGLGFLCYAFSNALLGLIILGMVVMTLGEIYYMPFASAFVATRADKSNKGQYMALYTVAWSISSVFAPAVGFEVADIIGFNNLWILMFGIGIIGAIGFWMMGEKLSHLSNDGIIS